MKIALVATSLVAAAATASTVYLLGALGRISWTGYLLGWSEAASGQEVNGADFSGRILSMQKAQQKADRLHREWHAENPGKSCSEMPLGTGR